MILAFLFRVRLYCCFIFLLRLRTIKKKKKKMVKKVIQRKHSLYHLHLKRATVKFLLHSIRYILSFIIYRLQTKNKKK